MLNDQELVNEFVVESKEYLADIESQLLAIESGGAVADPALINQVFRAVHSIKGAAGFLGLNTIGSLTHKMETVLNRLRNKELVPDESITNVLLQAADQLRELLENVERSNEQNIDCNLNALEQYVSTLVVENSSAPQVRTVPPEVPPTPVIAMNSPSNPVIEESVPVESAIPGDAPAADNVSPPENPSPSSGNAPVADTSIRVTVAVLDQLMNLAGELVLSRNQLMQTVNSKESRNLDMIAARVDQVTSELQETIMQARMQEIGTVFNKFPRVVRDLCASLGKQCDLRLEGTGVELDKSIIEAIGSPLTHLVRNAIDHGMESPEERVQVGKPAKGTIILRAFHQAGKVNISISDNGRGINTTKIREKAVARGLISSDQAREMSDREMLRMIFKPGFSLAEKVTDVSGRGVGMDVVKTNIERLGGTINVDTELGQGTTINIKLPLTLAIIPSLIVRCQNQRLAIPQASISELVRVKAEELQQSIQNIKGAEVLRLRGELLPLVRLDQVLGAKGKGCPDSKTSAPERRAQHIIVVETGNFRYGLIVDSLQDSEEIVVKPLGRHMQECQCLAGATVLGDGCVAMILDVTGIAAYNQLTLPDDTDITREAADEMKRRTETQTVLIFNNNPSERFAVHMDLIARVERIRSEQIDSIGGRQMIQYRGGTLPLISLEDNIQALPKLDKERYYIAVYRMQQHDIGLLIPELVDIRELDMELDATTFREPGVMGSFVNDEKAVRVLDLYELTKLGRPDWFSERSQEQSPPERSRTILLAEDSDFFRKKLSEYLALEHCRVVACTDGQEAWEVLQSDPTKFDLVVTDIEMPRMNGFELTQRIKTDPSTSHLSVIAVTCLASEDDIQEGKKVGVDEYLIKLDREQLVATISRFLSVAFQPEQVSS
ncbi:MAG: chemotaxis protein CheW [Pirellulales bacterium]|nr:chemotaxis protein CheW [Pirellulales bacterium]